MENRKNIEFLAQNFSHLSSEGKSHLKDFLQNLVLLQGSALRPSSGTAAQAIDEGVLGEKPAREGDTVHV